MPRLLADLQSASGGAVMLLVYDSPAHHKKIYKELSDNLSIKPHFVDLEKGKMPMDDIDRSVADAHPGEVLYWLRYK